ncbi:hypothetical protein COV56_02690 [Candidatus Kuenenbacteria bacterium CG11_big_fil_rev_8_21_14_0_20_37_9]|uniref:DNA polymerase III subunit gamma/tau n=1 Tax=Candidatus Kuenenbacteria bacterium CG08_land_8_20_14_0_20_37_23 TaxID=1974617 RepID=A0A2M6XSD1_9BACT|nr:MAG: hypothetical protein COV56_02690 [Candidatus Kuenenbacteria bacterium CG11_big_fil_rev_8_21_14_0_20_37_9]PIU10558.1 MAG: hypothetical protein COT27_02520 [Candidatus Kuenenbacteria bacterium CG08_land_8_20_14_0_20_37_23]
MPSIYRKYRPKTFTEMVGQNHIKLTLQSELEHNSFVHAYLFCGPRGLGKTTAARLFAKAVNCENRKDGESEPCNKCQSCLEIMDARAFDLLEIDAASHTGVDNVRENIIDNVRFTPHRAKYKVFIIDEVHMLSISAFNALLKTLEEPPVYAIFILCTTEIHKVPETIISRCQRFDFKKVPAVDMIKRLNRISDNEGMKIDDEIYNVIAHKSEGCMRDAEGMLGQVFALGGNKITKEQAALVIPMSEIKLILELVDLVAHNNLSVSLDLINKLVDEGINLSAFNKELVEFLRKLLLIKVGAHKIDIFDFDSQTGKQVNMIIDLIDENKLLGMIEEFLSAGYDLRSASIAQLPFELALVKICRFTDVSRNALMNETPRLRNTRIKIENPIYSSNFSHLDVRAKKTLSETKMARQPLIIKKKEEKVVDFEKVKKEWVAIVRASHKKSCDLMFINEKMVWPIRIDGNALEIGFKYDLHRSRFDTNSNKKVLEDAIREIIGEVIEIKSRTLKPSELANVEMFIASEDAKNMKLNNVKATDENILEHILDSFGGELIDKE